MRHELLARAKHLQLALLIQSIDRLPGWPSAARATIITLGELRAGGRLRRANVGG